MVSRHNQKLTLLKYCKILIDNNKSEWKPWKVLAKEYISGKVAKTNSIAGIFQVICLHLRSPCFKADLKGKSHNLQIEWILCYSKYLVLFFSAFAVCTLKLWMVNLLWKKKSNRLVNTVCFRVQMIKGYMDITEWKHITHSGKCSAWYMKKIWKLQYQFADAQKNWFRR